MKMLTRALSPIFLALAACPGDVSAEQQQYANGYVFWEFTTAAPGAWMVDQQVWIKKKASKSYWSLQWKWTSDPQHGGYIGLQNDLSGIAIFSLWNGTEARGPDCVRFGGEGTGYKCSVPYAIDESKYVRYRLWRTGGDDKGQWWGGWILEEKNGTLVHTFIGEIKVDPQFSLIDTATIGNFAEYYGDEVARCEDVPLSAVGFTPPTANWRRKGAYDLYSKEKNPPWEPVRSTNICATGDEGAGTLLKSEPYDTGFATGVLVTLGGSLADQAQSSANLVPPPDMPDS